MIFTEEQEIFRQTVQELADTVITPAVQEILEVGVVPGELVQSAAETGLYGVNAPEEFGGIEMGSVEAAIILEEVAKAAPGFARSISAALSANELAASNEALAARYIPGIAGATLTAGYGEIAASTEADAAKSSWTEGDAGWTIESATAYVVNAEADVLCISDGVRAAFVDKGTPGVAVTPAKTLGQSGSGLGAVTLEAVTVPASNIVQISAEAKNASDVFAAAEALGCAKGLFARALEFCQMRTHDFKPMVEMDAIARKLGELQADILVNEAAVYTAAAYQDAAQAEEGEGLAIKASQLAKAARVHTARSLVDVDEIAVRLHGGIGYHDPLTWRYLGDSVAYGASGASATVRFAEIAAAL